MGADILAAMASTLPIDGEDGLAGSSLFIVHEGRRVWRADGLREGLGRTRILYDSVLVLPE